MVQGPTFLSLPSDRYLNLGSKSDLRAEISGKIVWCCAHFLLFMQIQSPMKFFFGVATCLQRIQNAFRVYKYTLAYHPRCVCSFFGSLKFKHWLGHLQRFKMSKNGIFDAFKFLSFSNFLLRTQSVLSSHQQKPIKFALNWHDNKITLTARVCSELWRSRNLNELGEILIVRQLLFSVTSLHLMVTVLDTNSSKLRS